MLTPDCKSKLRLISQKILENPARMYMDHWFLNPRQASALDLKMPECGTIGCIAGWVLVVESRPDLELLTNAGMVGIVAAEILEIDSRETFRLFHPKAWPTDLLEELDLCPPQSQQYAEVVAKRIELFIETEGEK